jgi:hypothetical protein
MKKISTLALAAMLVLSMSAFAADDSTSTTKSCDTKSTTCCKDKAACKHDEKSCKKGEKCEHDAKSCDRTKCEKKS